MPCKRCGESAEYVAGLEYDEKGEASYHCLNCVIEIMSEETGIERTESS